LNIKTSKHIITSFVGEGSLLKGDISVDGYFRLNGDLIGSIQATGRVLIAETGRLKGTVQSSEVVIGGSFKGDILATSVVKILSSALVLGNIYSPRIILEEGGCFEGYASVNPSIAEKSISPKDIQPIGYFSLDIKKEKEKNLEKDQKRPYGEVPWIQ